MSSTTTTTLHCDGIRGRRPCRNMVGGEPFEPVETVRQNAREEGWDIGIDHDLCPDCKGADE